MKLDDIMEIVNDIVHVAGKCHTYANSVQKILKGDRFALDDPDMENALSKRFGQETYQRVKTAYRKHFAIQGGEVFSKPSQELLLEEYHDRNKT
ncbi:MAG: hypothetical protein WC916_05670 [Candidatus Woesearchaeota archaeon]